MQKIFNKGHRIRRASDKYLVYHFSIGTLLFVFVAVLLLLNMKQLMRTDWEHFSLFENPYIFYYYCIGYHNGKLVRDVQLFTAICYFKTVRWRNSFEKICKLHLCFRFPDFYLWKIFSN